MNIHRASIRIAIGLLALLAATFPAPARAQSNDPAALLPDDAILYVARMGSAHVQPAMGDTAWGRLLAEPEVQRFCKSTCAALDKFVAAQSAGDENAHAIYRAAADLLGEMEKHPTAFALFEARMTEQGPDVQAALVCRAADAAAGLVKKVDRLLQLTGAPEGAVTLVAGHSLTRIGLPVPVSLYYGDMQGVFVVALGDETVKKIAKRLKASADTATLASSPSLKLARERIGGSDASRSWTLHLDLAAAIDRLRPLVPMIAGGPDAAATIEKAVAALGLDSVRSLTWELHYRDGGCVSGTFLHTPDGGRGLFARGTSSITDDDLALIPRNPSWAVAFKFDIAGLYRGILAALQGLAPDVHAAAQGGIGEVEKALGFRIDEDFLSLIGDTIILYDTPDSGGFWFTGMTAIVTVKDDAKLRERTAKILKVIDDLAPDEGLSGKFSCGIGTLEHRGHTIEFVNLTGIPMPIAPAWTIHKGRLVKSFYPQMVVSALDRLLDGDAKADSILANDDVIKARRVLGDVGDSFTYVDARGGLDSAYPIVLLLAQTGAAMAQGAGVEIDIAALPSLSTLRRHLFADVRLSRADASGILSLSHGAWPTPATPSVSGGVASSALMASVLLPSLSRARELSKRTVCASNMRGIGQALYIHAQDHDGRFPDDIRDVIKADFTTYRQFVCPSTAVDMEDVEQAIDACYLYIPGQATDSHPGNVLLHERLENHAGEGVNVLFQDGHVEFITDLARVETLVQETRDRIAAAKPAGEGGDHAGHGQDGDGHADDGEDHDHDGDGVPDHD